jgi:hypothetical protein
MYLRGYKTSAELIQPDATQVLEMRKKRVINDHFTDAQDAEFESKLEHSELKRRKESMTNKENTLPIPLDSYDYLLNMSLSSLTAERLEAVEKERASLQVIMRKTNKQTNKQVNKKGAYCHSTHVLVCDHFFVPSPTSSLLFLISFTFTCVFLCFCLFLLLLSAPVLTGFFVQFKKDLSSSVVVS